MKEKKTERDSIAGQIGHCTGIPAILTMLRREWRHVSRPVVVFWEPSTPMGRHKIVQSLRLIVPRP
ncbi:MAG: hypothetical protein WCL50_15645, partial [Spirochaetota bacterium]